MSSFRLCFLCDLPTKIFNIRGACQMGYSLAPWRIDMCVFVCLFHITAARQLKVLICNLHSNRTKRNPSCDCVKSTRKLKTMRAFYAKCKCENGVIWRVLGFCMNSSPKRTCLQWIGGQHNFCCGVTAHTHTLLNLFHVYRYIARDWKAFTIVKKSLISLRLGA